MSDESTKAEGTAQRAEANCLCGGFGPSLSKMVQSMAPSGAAGEHFRRARIEMLKGIREVVNRRIEELSKGTETQGTKVTVE
jgi:hypothetical protein